MGQYFIVVNFDKKEYFEPYLKKMWEILSNNDIKLLAYLLFTDNIDGCGIIMSNVIDGWNGKKAKKVWGEYVKFKAGIKIKGKEVIYYAPKTKYLGRWCCDRIGIIGDYSEGSSNYNGMSYTEITEKFKNITEDVKKEFARVFPDLAKEIIPENWKDYYIRPDMVFSIQPIPP